MKRNIFIMVFLFFFFSENSLSHDFSFLKEENIFFCNNTNQEYSEIDSLVILLAGGLKKEIDKVRAIFTWITNHIDYDLEKLEKNKNSSNITTQKDQTQSAETVYKTRTAVCEGYSNLLKYMCSKAGILSETVEGVGSPQKKVFDMHGWNAVRIDNVWYLLDATWAAGGINERTNSFIKKFDNRFYLLPPEEFVRTHYPADPMWQLLSKPITREDFDNEKFDSSYTGNFNFTDTIMLYFESDSMTALMASNRRAYEYDRNNFVARKNYESLLNYFENKKMIYSNFLADTGIAKYNECIEIINRAKKAKRPALLDNNETMVEGLISTSLQYLNKSLEIYLAIKFTDNTNTQILEQNLSNIKFNLKQVNELKRYLEKYYGTPKAMRIYAL